MGVELELSTKWANYPKFDRVDVAFAREAENSFAALVDIKGVRKKRGQCGAKSNRVCDFLGLPEGFDQRMGHD